MKNINKLLKQYQAGVVQRSLMEQPTPALDKDLTKTGKALVAALKPSGPVAVILQNGKTQELESPRLVFSTTTFEAVLMGPIRYPSARIETEWNAEVIELPLVERLQDFDKWKQKP